MSRNGIFGSAGDEREGADDRAGDERRLALVEDLAGDVGAEVLLGGGARDDDAGRDGDQQRGDLRAEAVADRQQREVLGGLAERQALLHDADDDAADEVDQRDQDAGHRVALDELRGAVHRAVEVGLVGDLRRGACAPRSSVIWPVLRSASIAICLPGIASRVKRAPTSATRPAPLVITTNWMTMRIRKMTRPTTTLPPTTKLPNASTTWPASPCEQDQARDGDVDRQPEERREQQQRRERGEVQRARHVERRDDDHQRRPRCSA